MTVSENELMVEIKGIRKIYPFGDGEVRALDGIDIEVRKGDFVAIVGPSGSGKSTLMNMIGCLDTPTEGTYILDGVNVSRMNDDELAAVRNRKVGFVFQVFNLLPRQNALDNVELPLLYGRARDSRKKSAAALARVGLANRDHHRPTQLSGGQCQRVAIARALANQPAIILADEPTGALDSKTGKEIMALFSLLNRAGATLIMVTHDLEVASYARKIYHLHDGKVSNVELPEHPKCDGVPDVEEADSALLPRDEHHSSSHGQLTLLKRLFLLSLSSLFVNKLRSFLTMLGMIIGVSAVIIMMSLGEGTKTAVRDAVRGMGTNLLIVVTWWPRRRNVQTTHVQMLRIDDVKAIVEYSPYVVDAAPENDTWAQTKYYNRNYITRIVGTTPSYEKVRNATVAQGKFFDESDHRWTRMVCTIGMVVKRELFGEGDPIGKQIKINGKNFTVIGIMEEKGMAQFMNMDDQVFIPLSTYRTRLFGGRWWVESISCQAISERLMNDASEDIEELMRRRHKIKEDQESDFRVFSQQEILRQLGKITSVFQYLLAGIASISLLVGGIGIMNIMLVSVAERTREIGVRKAIGARRKDILLQFLIESVVMSLAGGLIGIGLGVGICKLASSVLPLKLIVTPTAVLLGSLTSMCVGLFFGSYPSHRASRLNPIDALRYE
ncbi:MAG TPA: ABC transporter permease [Candidatus Brocadiia bacterium]|nr:ABC transporter permease [Candidatus Brocadiia bacterium]